jgi:hypothetical protein
VSIVARIHAAGGKLRRDKWRATLVKRGALSADAVAWIKDHKADLMREIWPLYDEWDERAAIIEYDGGLPRDRAEALAYQCVTQCR